MKASRYAEALYKLAKSKNSIGKISQDLHLIDSLSKIENFKNSLESPNLRHEQKISILKNITFSSDLTINFLSLLIARTDFYLFSRILDSFHFIWREDEKILRVKLYSATKLNENFKSNLLKVLSEKLNQKIQLRETIDPSLLGGLKLKFRDKVVDCTFKNYLNSIAENIKF